MTEPQRWVERLGYEQDRQQPLQAVHGGWLAGPSGSSNQMCSRTVSSNSSGRQFCGKGKMSEKYSKKINRQYSCTASLTPKHHMLMLELPELNSQSWWKVSSFLKHTVGDTIASCWCAVTYPLCAASQALPHAKSHKTLFFSLVQELEERGGNRKENKLPHLSHTHIYPRPSKDLSNGTKKCN